MEKSESTIDYYQNNSSDLAKSYESANVDSVQELITRTFQEKSKLLELGCGTGREISFLLNKGYDVLGTDASESMLTQALLYHPELDGRLTHLIMPSSIGLTQESFDGVYSVAMLMHLPKNDITASLNEIYKILKIGGHFLFSISLIRDDVNEYGYDSKGRFFSSMSADEWCEICRQTGFVISSKFYNKDGLGRDAIEWITLIITKENDHHDSRIE